MQEMYREQVMRLEDELSRIREEGDIGKGLFKVSKWKADHCIMPYHTAPYGHYVDVQENFFPLTKNWDS